MANNQPSTSQSPGVNYDSTTKVTDVNMDSLVHCTNYLSLQDISNMAVSCKFLNQLAYSDSIWRRFFRERWPQLEPFINSQTSCVREAYLSRYTALKQFKFDDPLVYDVHMETQSTDLLLSKNYIYISQGPRVQIMSIDKLLEGTTSTVSLNDHRARITCMRLFPLKETSLFRNESQINENVLVTSSCDHSIRLWWKGSLQRSFKGHNGPVTVLSDKLLGDESGKVFASGGEDITVRLWSMSSKHGQQALKATLYGHEKPIVLISVTGHRESLLVSMSKDSKVRVWDASISSSSDRKSSCVGTTSVVGGPVGIKCHDSLIYIAAGSNIEAVDLRTMKTCFRTSTTNQGKLYSFDINPSKFLACTGELGRAMLWDIRKTRDTGEAGPVAELEGNIGPVTHLHMDPYKIVTGGPQDPHVNIWEAVNGNQTNVVSCTKHESGCSAMVADGFRIVTAGNNQELCFRDFSNAMSSVSLNDEVTGSKFWCLSNSGDGDVSD